MKKKAHLKCGQGRSVWASDQRILKSQKGQPPAKAWSRIRYQSGLLLKTLETKELVPISTLCYDPALFTGSGEPLSGFPKPNRNWMMTRIHSRK